MWRTFYTRLNPTRVLPAEELAGMIGRIKERVKNRWMDEHRTSTGGFRQ
jgi:hypothetical protein